MKKVPAILKNRYIVSALAVLVYILFVHDTDIFTLIKRKQRVGQLQEEIIRKQEGIEELKFNLNQLEDIRLLERYAREEYLFKRENEDLFIFSFE